MTAMTGADRPAAGAALVIAAALAPPAVLAGVTADPFPTGPCIIETGARHGMDRATEPTDGAVELRFGTPASFDREPSALTLQNRFPRSK